MSDVRSTLTFSAYLTGGVGHDGPLWREPPADARDRDTPTPSGATDGDRETARAVVSDGDGGPTGASPDPGTGR